MVFLKFFLAYLVTLKRCTEIVILLHPETQDHFCAEALVNGEVSFQFIFLDEKYIMQKILNITNNLTIEICFIRQPKNLEQMQIFLQLFSAIQRISTTSSSLRRLPALFIILSDDMVSNLQDNDNKFNQAATTAIHNWNIYFPVNSDVYVISVKHPDSFTLFEIYTLDTEKLIINQVSEMHNIFYGKLKRRNNFRNITISLVATNMDSTKSEIMLEYLNGKVSMVGEGISTYIVKYLEDSFGFRSKILISNEWPTKYLNGTWVGMGRILLSGEAEVSIVRSSFLPARGRVFTLLVPYTNTGLEVFFIQPPASSIRNVFVNPFHWNVWTAILSTLLLLVFTLGAFGFIQSHQNYLSEIDTLIIDQPIELIIRLLSQQGFDASPTSSSVRFAYIIGLLFSTLTYIAYTAALVSFLSEEVVPIKTFNDVLQSPSLTLSGEDSSSGVKLAVKRISQSLPENQKEMQVTKNGKKMTKPVRKVIESYVNLKNGTYLVTHESYALMSFADSFYNSLKSLTYDDKRICEKISSVPVNVFSLKRGMLMRKNSPYKKFFNFKLTSLLQNGLMQRYSKIFYSSFRPGCSTRSQNTIQLLGVNDLFTAFLIIAIGCFVSMVMLVLETCIVRFVD